MDAFEMLQRKVDETRREFEASKDFVLGAALYMRDAGLIPEDAALVQYVNDAEAAGAAWRAAVSRLGDHVSRVNGTPLFEAVQ